MLARKSLLSALCAAAVALLAAGVLEPLQALAAGSSPPRLPPAPGASSKPGSGLSGRALLDSHELWATIDVCNAPDQPYTVGIRGSMPGNGLAHDKMYMSFRLQYQDATSKQWVDLVSGATPAFVAVGSAAAARQDGRSFQLLPAKAASTLRGVVNFQWRRGGTIVQSATRPTTAGRKSLAGADPTNFSAASCQIT